jgi:dihydroxyacetone kinase-like predicted kinase
MERALVGVHAVEVTNAVRDSRVGDRDIAKGEVVGMLDGRLVSSGGEVEEVVLAALGELPPGSVEVVTIYRGAEVAAAAAEGLAGAIRQRFPNLEVECHDGGQALYPFILSAE